MRRSASAGTWLGTLACLGLLALVIGLDRNFHASPTLRDVVPSAIGQAGGTLPDFTLSDLDGRRVSLSDFRGKRVVLTFERSVDW